MTTAGEEYRRQARECVRTANFTAGQDAKASLLAMAHRWLAFAQAMEQFAMMQAAVSPPGDPHSAANRASRAAKPGDHLYGSAA